MKVVLNVFIVPPDAPECIAAEMELRQLDPETIQMNVSNGVVNFKMTEMFESIYTFRRLQENYP